MTAVFKRELRFLIMSVAMALQCEKNMINDVFFFFRWKRQSAEEDIYKMDKSASAEGKN